MKIGEAHKTWPSSLQSANTIGAPMSPAPIVMADRTRKKHNLYYWRTVSGQHCLLAERDISAPISTSVNSSVRLTYFHTNRLLNELYKQEMEYVEEKMTAKLKHKQTSIATVRYHLLPVASLLTPLIFHYPLPLMARNVKNAKITVHHVSFIILCSVCYMTFYAKLKKKRINFYLFLNSVNSAKYKV